MANEYDDRDEPACPLCYEQIGGNCMGNTVKQQISNAFEARFAFSAIDAIGLQYEIRTQKSTEQL